MHACPVDTQNGPCGARLAPIEGHVFSGPNGELCQAWQCNAGHAFGVPRTRSHGPCPNCGHAWSEVVRGNPDRIAVAPSELPVGNGGMNELAVQLGLGGCV